MPVFKIKFDGMGFTSRMSMTDKELTEKQATRYTKQLAEAGELPPRVVAVTAARVSAEDGKEDGEWKVFVSVELLVEVKSLAAAENMEPPEEFLLKVADKMVKDDADSEYGLRGSFEVLDVSQHEGPLPKAAVKKAPSTARAEPLIAQINLGA